MSLRHLYGSFVSPSPQIKPRFLRQTRAFLPAGPSCFFFLSLKFYLCVSGCAQSSLLCAGFVELQRAGTWAQEVQLPNCGAPARQVCHPCPRHVRASQPTCGSCASRRPLPRSHQGSWRHEFLHDHSPHGRTHTAHVCPTPCTFASPVRAPHTLRRHRYTTGKHAQLLSCSRLSHYEGQTGPGHWEHTVKSTWGLPGGSEGKASACNVGNSGSIPGSGRSPGEGNSNPLQSPCRANPTDGEAW